MRGWWGGINVKVRVSGRGENGKRTVPFRTRTHTHTHTHTHKVVAYLDDQHVVLSAHAARAADHQARERRPGHRGDVVKGCGEVEGKTVHADVEARGKQTRGDCGHESEAGYEGEARWVG